MLLQTMRRPMAALAALAALALAIPARAGEGLVGWVEEEKAEDLAIDAYIYGYPLLTMEYTRRVSTNVAAPEGTHAPMGQFARLREYPTAQFRDVTAPNADTLYTVAWLDLAQGPWILSIPDMHGRYFLFPMLDGWTNVFQDPGKRTTGTGAQKYAIVPPRWHGALPAGVTRYESPTNLVWVLGRIYCTGTPQDYQAVHALQDQTSLVPLSAYGKPYTPPAGSVDAGIDTKTAVRDQVDGLSGTAYFTLLAQLLKTNPPAAADAPMVAKLARLGIVPGQDFDASKLDAPTRQAIDAAPKPAQGKVMAWMKEGLLTGDMRLEEGWLLTTHTGLYGTDYRQRALVTAIGLGANRPQDAIYPVSQGPDVLQKYDGAKPYVMHFDKGKLPPVNGFWSLTMYDANYFFVANPLNRYTLSERNQLKKNADGSVDLYIQHDSPGAERETNWLPAPAGPFILMLRMYWPKESPPSILDGTWRIPRVHEAS
jgi:hypothetical protein